MDDAPGQTSGEQVQPLSAEQRDRFFSMIAGGYAVEEAAAAVGATTWGLYRMRTRDPSFLRDWEQANSFVFDVLRVQVLRRVREGVERRVYHQGQMCDSYQHFSDALQLFVLRQTAAAGRATAVEDPDEGLEPHEIAERARKALEERMAMLSQRVRVSSAEDETKDGE